MNFFCKTIKFCNNFLCPFPAGDSTVAQSRSSQGHPGGLRWPLSEEIKVLVLSLEDKAAQAVLAVTWPPHSNCGLNGSWAGLENNHPLCAIPAVPRRLSTSYISPVRLLEINRPWNPLLLRCKVCRKLGCSFPFPQSCRILSSECAQGCQVRCVRLCALLGLCFSSCWHAWIARVVPKEWLLRSESACAWVSCSEVTPKLY